MADTLPKIQVTDEKNHESSVESPSTTDGGQLASPRSPTLQEGVHFKPRKTSAMKLHGQQDAPLYILT
jgi:hypothetical protein